MDRLDMYPVSDPQLVIDSHTLNVHLVVHSLPGLLRQFSHWPSNNTIRLSHYKYSGQIRKNSVRSNSKAATGIFILKLSISKGEISPICPITMPL